MRTQNTTTGAGTSAALPMLSEMLGSLLNYGSVRRKPQSRRKVVAVMPDGSETTISKSRGSGYNLPDRRCFTSHLSSAKQAWIDVGATIKTVTA